MTFYTSLSGLKGAETQLSVTANNIANVGTTGFKKSATDFGDIISASALQTGAIAGQGTRLKSISQQFTQGGFEASDRALDLGISGQGFFVTKAGLTGGQVAYTRAGSFQVDSDRFVTDSGGAYLQVLPVDSRGAPTATTLDAAQNLQLPLTSGAPKATNTMSLNVTLPVSADLPSGRTVYAPVGTKTYAFSKTDANSYNSTTSTTVYDAVGNALPATIYFVRTKLPDTTDATSTWDAHLFVGDTEVMPTTTTTAADGTTTTTASTKPLQLTFDTSGTLTAPAAKTLFDKVQPTGSTSPLQMYVDFGQATTKQANAPFTVNSIKQDGYAAGQLSGVTVGNDGLVQASFSNGETQALGKLLMANFANPSGLKQYGDSKWTVSGASGDPIISTAGADGFGTIQSGGLERANVDITEELVALIAEQRNFQANAKAIETANTMTSAIINLRN